MSLKFKDQSFTFVVDSALVTRDKQQPGEDGLILYARNADDNSKVNLGLRAKQPSSVEVPRTYEVGANGWNTPQLAFLFSATNHQSACDFIIPGQARHLYRSTYCRTVDFTTTIEQVDNAARTMSGTFKGKLCKDCEEPSPNVEGKFNVQYRYKEY